MAIIGRNAAVVQTGRLRLTGGLAWIVWGLLHVAYLPGADRSYRARGHLPRRHGENPNRQAGSSGATGCRDLRHRVRRRRCDGPAVARRLLAVLT